MGRIVRREFVGSRLLFVLLCLTLVGVPLAVLYLIEGTVTVDEEVPNPTDFMEAYRAGNLRRSRS